MTHKDEEKNRTWNVGGSIDKQWWKKEQNGEHTSKHWYTKVEESAEWGTNGKALINKDERKRRTRNIGGSIDTQGWKKMYNEEHWWKHRQTRMEEIN